MLTLRKLDFRKVLTATHDAVCSSSLSQPDAQLPEVPADLRLFDMSLSRPKAKSRDFLDNYVLYNPKIENAGDPVIQSINPSLPDAGFNPAVPSLLDLQCSSLFCSAAGIAIPPSALHAPPARIHAAVYKYAGRNSIAVEYSGIELLRADF